jgi:hypothetical protein
MRNNRSTEAWDLAGLFDAQSGRPVDVTSWGAPVNVILESDRLVWRWDGTGPRDKTIKSGNKMLEEFVRLVDAPATRVRDYANRWGVLDLCKHGLPVSHSRPPRHSMYPVGRSCVRLQEEPKHEREMNGWEPIESWRGFASLFRTLLNLAAAIHKNGPGEPEDWKFLDQWIINASRRGDDHAMHTGRFMRQKHMRFWEDDWSGDFRNYIEGLRLRRKLRVYKIEEMEHDAKMDFAQMFFSECMSYLLTISNVEVFFFWPRTGPIIQLAVRGLFDALVVHLMLAVSRSQGFVICSSCGELYAPQKRPRRNQRHYCKKPECKKDAWRYASARHYERKQRNQTGTRKSTSEL